MNIQINGYIENELVDKRVNSKCFYIQLTIKDYLGMVDLEGNPYQRSLLGIKLYKKLVTDILEGAVFPPISVVYPDKINLKQGLDSGKKFKILDGLQRTNCLFLCKDILQGDKIMKDKDNLNIIYKNVEEFLNRLITLEVWENLSLKAILYKIVVLNTGQRRMDTKHQLDILFYSLQETLTKQGIEIITLKEKQEDDVPIPELYTKNIFPLSTIAEGLVSYLNKLPSYSQKDAADFLFETLSLGEDEFEGLLKSVEDEQTYTDLVWALKIFSGEILKKYNFNILIKYPLFLSGFMAALGFSKSKLDLDTYNLKKNNLILLFNKDEDPLRLTDFGTYFKKFKSGIGVKRRKLVYKAFQNYFLGKFIDTVNWREAYEELI